MLYFKAGLENNERCLWVTGQALDAELARSVLRAAVPDLDKRERDKQIEFANSDEWYAAGEKLRPHDLVSGLTQREHDALGLGYAGLRTNGNCASVSRDQRAGPGLGRPSVASPRRRSGIGRCEGRAVSTGRGTRWANEDRYRRKVVRHLARSPLNSSRQEQPSYSFSPPNRTPYSEPPFGTPTPVQKSQCGVALWVPQVPVVISVYWD
jgi:MEDS: MEthanogen/methylotroph, DcmR Sensory domain